MTEPKKPADRKPKAVKPPAAGEFTHDGITYVLPPPSAALEHLPGRALRDALLGGDEGEVRLGFRALEACGAPQDALDALYAKPIAEMMRVIGPWLQSADLSGATLPES
jgi:hypothetical protein